MENDAQRYVKTLSDEELNKLILTLGNYAVKTSKNLRWRSGNPFDLPKGEGVESMVSLAFALALEGKRKWNPEANPEFAGFLMDIIDSRLSHLATSHDNVLLRDPPPDVDFESLNPVLVTNRRTSRREQSADWLSKKPRTPEEELFDSEAVQLEKKALRALEEAIHGDSELVSIYGAIKKGCDSDKEIAQSTGLEIEKVRTAKKRMGRRIDNISSQFRSSQK